MLAELNDHFFPFQTLGRGTRLDPKSGKFSFTVLDFVGLCPRMEDNGLGTLKENKKVVKPRSKKQSTPKTVSPKGECFLIDNLDLAHLMVNSI